jgi:nucleotide-binding universal stress UspA family protein
MYRNILIPVDGSEAGAHALPVASAIAHHCGARLHVVMVHDPSTYIPFVPGEVAVPVFDEETISRQREESEAAVGRLVAELQSRGIPASGTVLEGTTVETIADHAVDIGIELTVMSTHGRSGFNRLRLGSVASGYVTRTSTPTLLVRVTAEGGARPAALPSGTLLCPLDGSPFSEAILPHARRFAESLGLQMELLSITTPSAIPMAPFGTEALLSDPRDLTAQEEGRQNYLERVAAGCPPGTTTRAITDMAVGNAIIEAARAEHVGAIALATHGRSGIMRFVLGSVADEVLRGAEAPILVYKPDTK